MNFSLRKSISLNKTTHKSTFFKNHSCPSSSIVDHPSPSFNLPAATDYAGGHFSMTSTPSAANNQQIIVNINGFNSISSNLEDDGKKEKEGHGSSLAYTSTSSMDFSFKRTSSAIVEDPTFSSSDFLLMGKFLEQDLQRVKSLDIEMGDNQQNDHQNNSIWRQGSGLPPLPKHDNQSRLSDVQSSDFVSNNRLNHMLSMQSNHSNNNNDHGSRDHTRVSFQEKPCASSSDDEGDNNDGHDDDDDHHDGVVHDEDNNGSSAMKMNGGGMHVHKRRSSKLSKANVMHDHVIRGDDHHEVLRCTSINSSPKKMSNAVSISKTRSRLMDPPLDQFSCSGVLHKSGQLIGNNNNNKSGAIKSSNLEEDEDDPFIEDDFPEEFKKAQISTLVILEWVSLVALVGSLICSLVIPVLKVKSIWELKLWKWEVFGLSLVCGRLLSGWGIKIIVFFIERNFLLRKRVLYFVYGLKKAVQNVIWLGLVLLTWHCIFNRKVENEANSEPLKVVTKLLVIGEIGAVLWLLKILMVKVCASSFHVKAFFERIQESLFNQFVIETLSAPPLFELKNSQEEEDRAMAEVQMLQNAGINIPIELKASMFARTKSGLGLQHLNSQGSKTLVMNSTTPPIKSPVRQSLRFSGPISRKYHDEGITIDRLHKLNQKNVSAWNMKRLIKIVRHGFLTTLDEHIENTNATHEDEYAHQIRSEVEAKAAARKIFRNVAKPRSKYICYNDLLRFMQEDEALKTMGLFEGASETGKISKSALKNWVVNAFRERRALALTLSDTKTAVNKLHKMVDVLVMIIIILIAAVWLNIITSRSVVFLSSQVVVAAFVFGNTCKNVFESIIFLFVVHPFDVGDRCEIEGVQMIVEEMNILTTVFLRYDNQKIIYPNYVLLSKPINNFYRSPDMGDAVEFCVNIATPPEKIALIKQRITSYILNKKEHWHPDPMVVTKDAESLYLIRMAVWVTHRMNFQDMGERWTRRALLVEECIKIFREMDIEYRSYPMNFSLNSMPAVCFPTPTSGSDPYISEGAKEIAHH
ncbi:unnamed protein product [Amaranthus hypochondriacus]